MCKDQVLNNAMQEGHVLTEEDQVLEHSDLQDRGTNGKRLTPRTLPFRKKKKKSLPKNWSTREHQDCTMWRNVL